MEEWDKARLVRFFGGRGLIYILGILLLIGLNIVVYSNVSFIFDPVFIFIETVALPIILSAVVYYLLRPVIVLLERVGIKRIWGILLTTIIVAGLITLLVFLVIPFFEQQFMKMIEELPDYLMQMAEGLDQWLKNSIFAGYYNDLFGNFSGTLDDLPQDLSTYVGDALTGLTSFISTVTTVIIAIVTLPFILFYLLKDDHKLPGTILRIFPPRLRPEMGRMFRDIDHQLAAYIQGQIIVSFCIGVMLYIGFLIIGIDYPVVLAGIASVTSVVPYLGPTIAITPALIIAIVTSPFMLVKLVLVWTVVQLLEGKFISPQIMGKRLHVHPVTIIFVLLTAGHLFGVIGIILAIPGYAILKVIVSHLFAWFKRRYNKFAPDVDRYEV
ncbi:AI-2E family transporter [Salimicrobium halophilum]|uniref:Predicted PurR-regulated permease PerM n=1 Tax=Salimicrobium halophilum TaxID=86666 RepID=A0A1G8VSX2_9BACI|nr:AI-2E family transporter [Salimicrobium halophilum]SDJ69112.1 Predicted PurR-regulated permease PerM [Salimicrobium halophilum]